MKRIAIVLFAVCLCTATPAFGGTSRTVGFGGYGPAKWGQTVAQSEQALGVHFDCSGTSCHCPTATPSLPVQLAFANGRLVAAWTYDPSVRAARGIQVGASVATVREAFPHAKKRQGPIGGADTTYLLARGSAGVIAFELTRSKVSGFDAGPSASAFSQELC